MRDAEGGESGFCMRGLGFVEYGLLACAKVGYYRHGKAARRRRGMLV
jgi:hypothetical protein